MVQVAELEQITHCYSVYDRDSIYSTFGTHGMAEHDRVDLQGPLRDRAIELGSVYNYPFESERQRAVWLSRFPNCLNLWSDYVFDAEGMRRFLGYLAAECQREPLQSVMKALYILVNRRHAESIDLGEDPVLS